jgi:hypothetical protein
MSEVRIVHIAAGFTSSGDRVRAACSCGFRTTPRVDRRRALVALQQHGLDPPVCTLCERDARDRSPATSTVLDQYRRLEVITDPETGEQFLACRDDRRACNDLARRRQVELDRAAFEAFSLEPPRPQLRVVHPRGGRG